MQIKELGHVVLYVTDLKKVGGFYKDILGFPVVAEAYGALVFSAGRTHHEMLLLEVGGTAVHDPRPKPGLYHIGFKVGDSADELRAVYQELKAKGVTIVGTADHGVTHSIYMLDPDGNELELYADVSNEWRTDPPAIMTPTRPLNLD